MYFWTARRIAAEARSVKNGKMKHPLDKHVRREPIDITWSIVTSGLATFLLHFFGQEFLGNVLLVIMGLLLVVQVGGWMHFYLWHERNAGDRLRERFKNRPWAVVALTVSVMLIGFWAFETVR
jgi:hypothetical protein